MNPCKIFTVSIRLARVAKVVTVPCNCDWYPGLKSGLRPQLITTTIFPRYVMSLFHMNFKKETEQSPIFNNKQ